MSGSEEAVQVETSQSFVTVLRWRQGADWADTLARTLVTRADRLALRSELDIAREMLAETGRQLTLTADLLEGATEAAASVGFELGSSQVPETVVGAYRALMFSVDDQRGLRAVDLADPAPAHRAWSTAHFGYVPLWGPGGPRPDDVYQGYLGDCSLMAVLASVAGANPKQITQSIVDHGDGTYTVTIDGEAIRVDDEFVVWRNATPLYANGPEPGRPPTALWPLLYEKAAALAEGGRYEDIVARDPAWAHDLFGGTDEMSLSQTNWFDPSNAKVWNKLDEVLDAGRSITATSMEVFGLGGGHAWSVVATDASPAGPTVTVRNPWGNTGFTSTKDDVRNPEDEEIPDVDADDIVLDEDAGTVTMPLDVFMDQFDELDYVTEWD